MFVLVERRLVVIRRKGRGCREPWGYDFTYITPQITESNAHRLKGRNGSLGSITLADSTNTNRETACNRNEPALAIWTFCLPLPGTSDAPRPQKRPLPSIADNCTLLAIYPSWSCFFTSIINAPGFLDSQLGLGHSDHTDRNTVRH